MPRPVFRFALLFFCTTLPLLPETGYDAWLRYKPVDVRSASELYAHLPLNLISLGRSEVVASAQAELVRGIRGLLGHTLRVTKAPFDGDLILLGTVDSVQKAFPGIALPPDLIVDGYALKVTTQNTHRILVIASPNERGILYGTFALLRRIALRQRVDDLDVTENPFQPIRWVNEWDNLDGSIERGYARKSIFFVDGNVMPDLTRAGDYARLLASAGINGCTINNVNANPRILAPDFLGQLARLASAFRPWGVQLSLSVPFNAPKTVGGLGTFDPLEPRVQSWWKDEADQVYRAIPDLAGFLVKADSEGQLGPSVYGRSHADAANVLADALRPHHGIVIYRGFVYNHHLDWRDLKNDRAKAAYENFHPLDGKFASNVVLQIKYGPIDFQAREPVSPLIGALRHTNEALELQITQEYTGQQRHLCYLVPMWKQVLDFDLHANGGASPVSQIVSGTTFKRPLGGMVGVANVGLDRNWLGADLAMANLYGFGRLAWNPSLRAEEITSEWTQLTWGHDSVVDQTVMDLELESWRVYEGYTGPLGIGTLTDILHGHYGPGIETAERNGWGQWIRADNKGIGMDRTIATGTGYIGQYSPEVAQRYESLQKCPDNLLLFMHHVPYTHVLHSGQTVVQEIYDSHYRAAAEAQQFPKWWETLRNRVDNERYLAVLARLEYQAGHAVVWRDAICNWFLRQSNISDDQGRIGRYPERTEAEAMRLQGYRVIDVTPWEDASGGKAISCSESMNDCSASMQFGRAAGLYDFHLQYFDTAPGQARFQVFVGNQLIQTWSADADFAWKSPNGDSSSRESIVGVPLEPGDTIRILGSPDQNDRAAVDYIEIMPTR